VIPILVFLSLSLGLLVGMLAALEVGVRLGRRRLGADPERALGGLGGLEGAIFGLLGLMIAFTFSGALSRFDRRRDLIVEETNAVGTAWLRIDALADPAAREPLRDLFRSYLDWRLEVYRRVPDVGAAKEALARANAVQGEIWGVATTACRYEAGHPAAVLLLPALNAMFDVATSRTAAVLFHPHPVLFVLLFLLALGSSLLAGYGLARAPRRSCIHEVAFLALVAATVYVIFDLEYPRLGLIRVDAADQVLAELRESMNPR
jgi:hypothetical protein